MNTVYISGRGLACALGNNMELSLATLRTGGVSPASYTLPGVMGGRFPYFAIPGNETNWNEKARDLVQRVALAAGAQQACNGALFIATSSFDIGGVEHETAQMDYTMFSDKIRTWLGWTGPVYVINTACTSGINALLAAHALLAAGEAEDALVLGMELNNRLTLGGFASLQLLSRSGSKPFGAHRDGLVLGEAVAALRLSTREKATWKIAGGANVVDGSQPTGASIPAVVSMYQQALAACDLSANAIDLIKVQAAGSPGNDVAEARGLLDAFQSVPPLVSLKSALGHTMGASGAAEIALLTACLEHDAWPCYEDAVDHELGIDLATRMPQTVRRFMATILGFGGSHATVVLERA
jgi:3-oxoacyl-[acyl-carrier-protein] synthase-1